MRSSTLRGIAASLLLAALFATEAMPVLRLSDRCACGMVAGACCHLRHQQSTMKPGASCHLGKGGPMPRCSMGQSQSLPASLESQREPVDRPGLRQVWPGEILLAPAGWIAEASPILPPSLAFDPPVPPPRSSRRV
jgi:hypothetical protein